MVNGKESDLLWFSVKHEEERKKKESKRKKGNW